MTLHFTFTRYNNLYIHTAVLETVVAICVVDAQGLLLFLCIKEESKSQLTRLISSGIEQLYFIPHQWITVYSLKNDFAKLISQVE